MIAATHAAYDLLMQGTIALAQVEANGICIDVPYLEKTSARIKRKVTRLREELEESDVVKTWRKRFRSKTNINSHPQLATVLFDEMGYKSHGQTAKGKRSTDKEALETIEHPFVDKYLRIQKLEKLVSTNFRGIAREVVNGMLHCFYDLGNVRSYRSASSDINFQNQPIRDPESGPLVRRAFVARQGNRLVELDLKGAEVKAGASEHHDPVVIKYILDPTTDMHRDSAMELFKLPLAIADEKLVRGLAKGAFVFAEFYGSWWFKCAPNMWKQSRELKLKSGKTLREHLVEQGITSLGFDPLKDKPDELEPGSFGERVKRAERSLWDKRFVVYKEWKTTFYDEYLRKGYIKLNTGFICRGPMDKKQVCNYPIQGPSFHCLLWSLIKIAAIIAKRGMKTLIVGQIHDSILFDAPPEEVPELLAICKNVIEVRLREHYPWLVVPMVAEYEASPVNGTWFDKCKVEI